jgi:rhodanese-related sulfurtransferase
MKTLLQAVGIVAFALAAAGVTYWIKGPPNRAVPCDPAALKADEVCLSRVSGEWQGAVLWVDARSRAEWQRDGVAGSILWNLDETEDMQAFEAEAVTRMLDGQRVVVYCTNEDCGVSRQVADRIRALQLGNEVWVLYGGWRALAAAKLTKIAK